MKKIIKSRMFYFILGFIIAGSVGVYAATQYAASQITYNKNGQATVEAALNDLYTKSNENNCVSGSFDVIESCTTSTGCELVNFEISNLYLYIEDSSSKHSYYYNKDKSIWYPLYYWNNTYYNAQTTNNVSFESKFTINNNTKLHNASSDWVGRKLYYMACK